MSHVSDFTKSQKELVVDLINYTNDSNLLYSDITLGVPTPTEGEQVSVEITPVPGSGYGGQVTVFYNRLDIQTFSDIVSPDGVVIPQGEATTLVDLLPQINALLGTALLPEDVIDVPIEGWDGTPGSFLDLYLDMAAHSLVYYGSLKVTIDDNDIPLSSIITNVILSGLNLPVDDDDDGEYDHTRYTFDNPPEWATAGELPANSFRINGGQWNAVPEQLVVDANTVTVDIKENVAALDGLPATGIEYFQTTAQPSIDFTKTERFVSVPDYLPPSVNSLRGMFYQATSFNQDIGGWDVSNVTDMNSMFGGASAFNQYIGGWNVSNVTNMSSMFYNASAFNQDLSGWDVSKVADMTGMFSNASAFNGAIGGWNVSNVVAVESMFSGASAFNQDIGGWDLSNVTSMTGMFHGATEFNQNISGWNVSNVYEMVGMFKDASKFNQDLSGWDVSNVMNHTNFDVGASAWTLPKPNFH